MKLAGFITAAAMLALAPLASAETAGELWRDGYQITWESAYEDVEECTPDNGVVLGELIFICDSYEYVYHYGAVSIASKSFTYKGRIVTLNFLCMEDEDECLSGTVIRRR